MRRRGYLAFSALAAFGFAITSAVSMPVKVIWNASASVPVGLYIVAPHSRFELSELVAFMPPEPLAGFLTARGYAGQGVPLLKRIAALPGQRVCRIGHRITIDGAGFGAARKRDRKRRELPVWQGCHVIAEGELFLMNRNVPDSLDGRYFGPVPADAVIGRAHPLWTDAAGDGRYRWRASSP